MSNVAEFIGQHKEILGLVNQVLPLIESKDKVIANSKTISATLSSLLGKIVMHLSLEDNFLYPKIMKIGPDQKKVAESFQTEMGGIKKAFSDFMKEYGSSSSIEAKPDDFVEALKAILSALGNRISREEKDLYPLAN